MRRRELITVAGAMAAFLLTARAQPMLLARADEVIE
jgi:hypothetical protein